MHECNPAGNQSSNTFNCTTYHAASNAACIAALLCLQQEEYAVLNLAFYEFLVLGLSMWAYGIRVDPHMGSKFAFKDLKEDLYKLNLQVPVGLHKTQWGAVTDYFLFSAPVLTGIMYLLGAEVLHTKVPIYILMLVVFLVLTERFYQVSGIHLMVVVAAVALCECSSSYSTACEKI